MGGLVRAVGKAHHIDHTNSVAQSVAQLLNADAKRYQPERCRLAGGEIDIDETGQGQLKRQRDEGLFYAPTAHYQSSGDTSRQHQYHAYPVNLPHRGDA